MIETEEVECLGECAVKTFVLTPALFNISFTYVPNVCLVLML